MRMNDAVLGVLLLAFAAAIALWSQTFPPIPGQQYGAAVFPTLVAAGMGGAGAVLIVAGLRQGGPALAWAEWARAGHGVRRFVITVAAILFYIVASKTLGFLLTMAPILLVMLRMLGVGWVASIALAVVVTVAIQYLFGEYLYVPLPWGVLAPVRW